MLDSSRAMVLPMLRKKGVGVGLSGFSISYNGFQKLKEEIMINNHFIYFFYYLIILYCLLNKLLFLIKNCFFISTYNEENKY